MENENVFLLYALLMGIFITFVYDILRIFRRVVPHGNFMVSLEDIGFWIYCAAKVFILMYHESNGTLRWFAVLGAMVGMFLYKKMVSSFFVKYASLVLQKFFAAILKPFFLLARRAKKAADTGKARASRKKSHVKWFIKKKLTFLWKVLK